ncbi:hypothetical protein FQN57_000929 [Myotisia sp. PD_48]|nr:hypothetical protein FQN57_000929 [Myotisia sp. PD_48]
MAESTGFSGYKWEGMSTFAEGTSYHSDAQEFLASVNWKALCVHATKLKNSTTCVIEPEIALGGRHMIRILSFEDGSRWIARLRITVRSSGENKNDTNDDADSLSQSEFDCMRLVKEKTTVPVPTVFGFVPSRESQIGAPVIFMECLRGNTPIVLKFGSIPEEHKSSFYEEMARIHVEISSLVFPKIGSIIRQENGSYEIGPIPGLGGPFETATEYFKAWSASARFPRSDSYIMEACKEFGEEVVKSTAAFPRRIGQLANRLAVHDNGPFPLCHPQFGYHKVIVDDNYKVLGVIDWEEVITAPWETLEIPWPIFVVPQPMDAPYNYDDQGAPKDEEVRELLLERRDYIAAVARAEDPGKPSQCLSSILGNQRVQDLAPAIRLFTSPGKMGLYSNILDVHYGPEEQ